MPEKRHVFIIGSKGIPGKYGGYETFVDKLTEYNRYNEKIKFHVACKQAPKEEFEYNGAHCFKIDVPNIGSAQAVYYDIAALRYCCNYIKQKHVKNPIVYILACRIGPFVSSFRRKIHQLGGLVYVNPDGHEWMRQKWSPMIRKYWKLSEKLMVKNSDLLICDSKNIEKYIKKTYSKYKPRTIYIAYGAELRRSTLSDDDAKITDWFSNNGLSPESYYLIVGRFVPENNFRVMIHEFMKSHTKKSLVIITNTNASKEFWKELVSQTQFNNDSRIKFVGTVYDHELLMKIRENSYGYIHGHEVGGTNPSLLEALSSTKLNLLLDVGFNHEVAEDAALYWNKGKNNLASLIDISDRLSQKNRNILGMHARERIEDAYSWQSISDSYNDIFLVKGSPSYVKNL